MQSDVEAVIYLKLIVPIVSERRAFLTNAQSATAPLSLPQCPEAAHVTLGTVVFGIISPEFSKENVGKVYKELDFGQVREMLPEVFFCSTDFLCDHITRRKSVVCLLGNEALPTPDRSVGMLTKCCRLWG